jgi:hypothetical protein
VKNVLPRATWMMPQMPKHWTTHHHNQTNISKVHYINMTLWDFVISFTMGNPDAKANLQFSD